MGLSLYVFGASPSEDEDPKQIAGWDVGHYSDFGFLLDTIARHLDAKRYPTLMDHSDCDGEWSLAEIPALEQELNEIAEKFKRLKPEEPVDAFEHTAEYRVGATFSPSTL